MVDSERHLGACGARLLLVAVPFASSALSSISRAPTSQATHPNVLVFMLLRYLGWGVCASASASAGGWEW